MASTNSLPQVLRYPYDAITKTTDYLQIDISDYKPVGASYIRDRRLLESNSNDLLSRTSGTSATTKVGGREGVVAGDSILLPMPSNIQDGNSVTYADDSMNAIVAKALEGVKSTMNTRDATGAIKGIAGLFDLGVNDEVRKAVLRSLAAQAVNIFGGNVTPNSLLAREQGDIFNPNLELLFNGVTLRSFKFSFKMTPRSEPEARQCRLILRTLKQGMAPKLGKDSGNIQNLYLSTPNIFNLQYKKGPDPHPFLHSFKQCALTDMAVNYTGENIYATYGGDLASPISMIMDLTFKELEPIYNTDYEFAGGVGY